MIDWVKRVKENGHTGLYCGYAYVFDQLARKKVLRQILSGGRGKKALDYGCGVGDFLPVLEEHFDNVTGIDSCVEVLEKVPEKYKKQMGKYDYIQLIAVLSSNSDSSAYKILRDCGKKLEKNGSLLIIDAVNKGAVCDPEQANRTGEEYRALFDKAGFRVEKVAGLYSVFLKGQCGSWDRYRYWVQECVGFDRVKAYKDAVDKCYDMAKQIVDKGNDFIMPIENADIYIWLLRR